MWSDRETERDCLGYASYVSVLEDVCLLKDIAPLTLGIFGSWGRGKTSLMKMLKASIDSTATKSVTAPEKPTIRTLWFNAWRYEGREEAQSALIHSILACLQKDVSLGTEVKDLIEKLKKGASVIKLSKSLARMALTMTPDIDGFIGAFKDESEKVADTMESFDDDFDKLLGDVHVERMVVFIDDLDRCSPQKVIETFETIKLFLNTPRCTFVIGADVDKIKAAVGTVYASTASENSNVPKDYLEKIVQIPFSIPEQSLKDITCYVGMLTLGRRLQDAGWSEMVAARGSFYSASDPLAKFSEWATARRTVFDFDGDGLDELLGELKFVLPHVDAIARGLTGNPRQIKRFLNILALRRRLAKANSLEVRPDLIIKLGVLEYAWEDAFHQVIETLDPDTGRSELLSQLQSATAADAEAEDSPLVQAILARPALVSYLNAEPKLTGELDLRPYLFLAQTALHRPASVALQPIEEEAENLAAGIADLDPTVSRARAKQAASRDAAVVSAVVPLLSSRLAASKDTKQQAHIILALDGIASRHPTHFAAALSALDPLEATENDALAMAVQALARNATTAGVSVPSNLQTRFKPKTQALQALTRRDPTPRGRR